MKLLVSLITILFSSQAHANDLNGHIQSYTHPIEDHFYSSFWSGCNVSDEKPIVEHILKYNEKTPYYKTENTKAIAYFQDHNKNIDNLMVYIPGSFVNLDDSPARNMVSRFLKNGQNVMFFPNPIGTDHVKAQLKYAPGNFIKEAEAFYFIFKDFLKVLRSKGFTVNHISIAGGSYGALTAAIMLDLDSNEDKLFKKATMFSPPFNFLRSFQRLDNYIDTFSNHYTLFPITTNWYTAWSGCKVKKLSQKQLTKLGALVIYHGFQSNLVKTIFAYEKSLGVDLTPDSFFGWLRSRFRNWRKSVKTIPLISAHMQDFNKIFKKPYIDLKYWLDRSLDKNPALDLLVLTAEDDFMNDLKSIPNDPNYIILKEGGHMGYFPMPWFEKFFELRFKNNLRAL